MRTPTAGLAARQVEAIFLDGSLGAWSDDRLLDRFSAEPGDRAERAFAAIVERHGPRVYRVCRAVTGDGPTAEDAFQATFLVLARKAGTLRVHNSLGPWLHGVAARLAASARASQARRNKHEAAAAHRGEPATTDTARDPDLSGILHAEIGRLPTAYRDAVYLCDVEGVSHEAAALRLSIAVGTVRSRLCRGRKRLRSRLVRRGIVPAALAASLAPQASAALPSRLACAAARNAVSITNGGASSGTVPAAAVALFEEGMTTMLKLKIRALLGATVVGLSATVAVVFAQDVTRDARKDPDPRPATTADPFRAPGDAVTRVVDPTARPATATATPAPGDSAVDEDALTPVKVPIEAPGTPPKPPEKQDVLDAILHQKFPDLRYRIEKIGEQVDPAKVYPLAGRCELVHVHYKATICYTPPGGELRRREEAIFLNRDYLRRVTEDTPKPDAGPATDPEPIPFRTTGGTRPTTRNRADRAPATDEDFPAPRADHQKETDRRLDEVERKLDRILKALEKDAPPPSDRRSF